MNHRALGTTRLHTITQKVPTQFGALYTHVSLDARGRVVEVEISTPGKHVETAIHEALVALGRSITACLPGEGNDG